MSSNKKPTPVIVEVNARICPVCGRRAYSSGGTHPQCAVRQSDAPRRERLRAEKKIEVKKPRQRSWTKKCPKCSVEVHVRKAICLCGHDFAAGAAGI